jgi:hypothetical protein
MALGVAALAAALLLPNWAKAGEAPQSGTPMLQQASRSSTDFSAQARRRPPTRLRVYPRSAPESDGVYPRYFPGPNAVRDCTATYVQEYRPSGTVIVPRMNCFWRRG